jgi:hypothetical protein
MSQFFINKINLHIEVKTFINPKQDGGKYAISK